MKNLKWFLGLALILICFAWQTPKAAAIDDSDTVADWLMSALDLLAQNHSLTATKTPIVGQVLGETITADQTTQPSTCMPPTSGCGQNMFWDQARCMCAANQNSQPPSSTGGTFFCYSLNRQATAAECDAADKANQPNQQPPQQPNQQPQQPPQNSPQPCPSGQVYLCSGNTNPTWSNGQMTCANGGQPFCGTLNNQQNQNISGTFFCYSLNRQATQSECDASDKNKLNTQPNQPNVSCPSGQQPECPSGAPKLINGVPTCPVAGETWTCQTNTAKTCQPFGYCNGRVIKQNGCDVCQPSTNNQNNQNDQLMNQEFNQDFNQEGDNFDTGRICTINDAGADIRDASRIIKEGNSYLKKKMTADLKTQINDLITSSKNFITELKTATDDNRCDVLDAWRNPDTENSVNPNEAWNALRIKVELPTQIANFKKELKTLQSAATTNKIKKTSADIQPLFKNFISDFSAAITEMDTAMQASEPDMDSLNDLRNTWSNDKNPGSARCALEAAVQFAKVDKLKLDPMVKSAILDIRTSFYESLQEDLFSEACQIANESRKITDPLINRPVTKVNTKTSDQLLKLQQLISDKYGNNQDQQPADNSGL